MLDDRGIDNDDRGIIVSEGEELIRGKVRIAPTARPIGG